MPRYTALFALLCAGCSEDRPTTDQLAEAIYEDGNGEHRGDLWIGRVNDGIDRNGARCMAGVLRESDVSDDALRALVDADESFELDTSLQEDLGPVLGKLGECMGVTGDPEHFLR